MTVTVLGVLQGNIITLDEPIPSLDGQRVTVILAPADEETALSAEENARLWDEWVKHGPQGPIEP
jgi:hypothetical protein